MDERLLAPCTADLLRGWTGPVHGYLHLGIPTRAVSIGEITDSGKVRLWTQTGDDAVPPSDLSLDLSLAECRDRVDRSPFMLNASDAVRHHAMETVDMGDMTRLPDGSPVRLALPMAAVWREVSHG